MKKRAQPPNPDNLPFADIGERLLVTRLALGMKQNAYCERLGITTNAYNPYEKGHRRITIDAATRMVREFGVTLDWIYLGDRSGLPISLAHRINAVRSEQPRATD